MLAAALIAVRDFLLSVALSWVGMSIEPASERAPEPAGSPAPSCASDSALCNLARPGFNALGCADD